MCSATHHCTEHLYTLAEAQFDDPEAVEQWVEAALAWLSLDQPGLVIAWLKTMKPANTGAKDEIRNLIGYLDNNRDRLGYAKCRQEGLPIGSGGIESANKCISHARLKRSGAWWLIPNGNNMLRLRCAIYNGAYDRVLRRYIASRCPCHGTLGDRRVMLPSCFPSHNHAAGYDSRPDPLCGALTVV